jgi:hypothetical protein
MLSIMAVYSAYTRTIVYGTGTTLGIIRDQPTEYWTLPQRALISIVPRLIASFSCHRGTPRLASAPVSTIVAITSQSFIALPFIAVRYFSMPVAKMSHRYQRFF